MSVCRDDVPNIVVWLGFVRFHSGCVRLINLLTSPDISPGFAIYPFQYYARARQVNQLAALVIHTMETDCNARD